MGESANCRAKVAGRGGTRAKRSVVAEPDGLGVCTYRGVMVAIGNGGITDRSVEACRCAAIGEGISSRKCIGACRRVPGSVSLLGSRKRVGAVRCVV